MERLKRVIRQGLLEQAHRIKLQVGTEFEILAQQGIRMMPDGPLITDDYVESLFVQLLPHEIDSIRQKLPTKGLLTIPQVGKVYLIAIPTAPASLRLYLPPRGHEMFLTDWERLHSRPHHTGLEHLSQSQEEIEPSLRASIPPHKTSQMEPPNLSFDSHPPKTEERSEGSFKLPFNTDHGPPSKPPPIRPSTPVKLSPPKEEKSRESIFGQELLAGYRGSEIEITNNQKVNPPPAGVSQVLPPNQDKPMSIPTLKEYADTFDQNPSNFGFQNEQTPLDQNRFEISTDQIDTHQKDWTHEQLTPPPLQGHAPTPIWHDAEAAHEADSYQDATIHYGPDDPLLVTDESQERPIDRILTEMVLKKASDLHLTCHQPICFRIDGDIQRLDATPITAAMMESLIDPMIPLHNRDEFIRIQDTDFAYEVKNLGRFRVNIFRDRNGVGAVIRHIPSKILTSEQLNLPPIITKFCQLTKGLVVVTGPTGSGKSTTLAAMVDWINKNRAEHILTIEDPIEFVHPQQKCLVNQREVHRHTTSFARALKAALREDPDIILIGELRDLETVAIAIETAETGHLVFGTLHTTTAVSTIDRIIDQFPSDRQAQIRTMLATSLKGVVAQTLLKKKGGGRVAAHEILVLNDAVAAMVREGKIHMVANHMQTQKSDGNVLLNESLFRLVKDHIIDADDAIRKAVDKNSLIEVLKRNNLLPTNQASTPPVRPAGPTGQKTA